MTSSAGCHLVTDVGIEDELEHIVENYLSFV